MNMSADMASRLRSMSINDSPLLVEERAMSILSTSAERRLAASSKVVRVRVLASKKRLITVLPRSSGTFLIARSPTSTNEAAVSRISSRMARGRPSMPIKLRSRPAPVSCRVSGDGSLMSGLHVQDVRSERRGPAQFYPLLRVQCQVFATNIGGKRQFALADVEQHGEGDAGGAAIVEQFIERGAHGAAAHQYVVHQHHVGVVDIKRQGGWLHFRVQAAAGEVVAVEADVQRAGRGAAAEFAVQCLGHPGTAGMDADQQVFLDAAFRQVRMQFGGHAFKQLVDMGTAEITHTVSPAPSLKKDSISKTAAMLSTSGSLPPR